MTKRGIFVGLLLVFSLFFVGAVSFSFNSPTPSNGANIEGDAVTINVTVGDSLSSFVDFDNSLLGWWKLNNNVLDDSVLDNDGILSGANYVSGVLGNSLNFDGINDNVKINFENSFLTRAFWKKDSGGEWMHVVEILEPSNIKGEEWLQYKGNADNNGSTLNHAPDSLHEHDSFVIGDQKDVISTMFISNGFLYMGGAAGFYYKINSTNFSRFEKEYVGGGRLGPAKLFEEFLYFGSNKGDFFQLNATDLSLINYYTAGGDISSSPTISNGYIYFGSHDDKMYQLNATDLSLINSYTTGGDISSSPAIANGYVYFGSHDDKMYQLNATDLSLINSYTTGGDIFSSPAIANGYVYFGSHDNKMYQLNATDLSLINSYTTGGDVGNSFYIFNNSLYVTDDIFYTYELNLTNVSQELHSEYLPFSSSSISPLVTNDSIYIFSQSNILRRYNLVWSVMETVRGFSSFEIVSSPIIVGDYLYIGSKAEMFYQLNNSNMELINTFISENGTDFGSPAFYDNYIYVADNAGTLYQLNSSNISKKIEIFQAGALFNSAPTLFNGYVYIGNYDNYFYQLNASNISQEISKNNLGNSMTGTAAVNDDYVYIDLRYKLFQLNASNVSEIIAEHSCGSYASSSPLLYGQYVYYGSYDDNFYQLNASNVSQEIARFSTGDDVASSASAFNGSVYMGSDDSYLYQLNSSNISQEFARFKTGDKIGVHNGPAISGGHIFVGSYDGYLYQLNSINVSQEIDKFYIGGALQSSPAIANGYVFFGGKNGKVYKLGDGKTYINGVENNSYFNFSLYKNNENLFLGMINSNEFYGGSLDDILFFDRVLNDAEIKSLYNSTAYPNFYKTFTGISEGRKNFRVYSQSSSGIVENILRYFIFGEIEEGSTGGSTGAISISFEDGSVARRLPKNAFVRMKSRELDSSFKILEVQEKKVSLNFSGQVIDINLNESGKIDLDVDGFYDVEVFYSSSKGYLADLVITEIHEKVPAVQEESKVEEGFVDSGEKVVEKKGFFRRIWDWFIGLFGK